MGFVVGLRPVRGGRPVRQIWRIYMRALLLLRTEDETLFVMSGPPYGRARRTVAISDEDAVVLIGVLAAIDGPLLMGQHPDVAFRAFRKRLAWEGLVSETASQVEVGQAFEEMVQRIRTARGEYDDDQDSRSP
jgi:hypothetical protein